MRRGLAWILVLLAVATPACGPRAHVSDAQGIFYGRHVRGLRSTVFLDGQQRLEVDLVAGDKGILTVELAGTDDDGSPNCWRSAKAPHECPESGEPGRVRRADFSFRGITCGVSGWVERQDSTWLVDVEVTTLGVCAEGRYVATIGP